MPRQIIIAIEGNIGVGKTTLLQRLSHTFPCFLEPVDEWFLLPFFYNHPKRYGPGLQFQILLSYFKQKQSFPPDAEVILVERCPETARSVFAPLCMGCGLLAAYDQVHLSLAYKADYFIYLDLEPEKCFQRLQCRTEMDRQIDLKYLRQLERQYAEYWPIMGKDVETVDASQPPDAVEQQVRNIILQWTHPSAEPAGTAQKIPPAETC